MSGNTRVTILKENSKNCSINKLFTTGPIMVKLPILASKYLYKDVFWD